MNLDDIKLSKVKYQMKSFVIDAGGNTLNVPISQIMNIKIEKNYDNDAYPFFYVGVNVPGWFYRSIVENSHNLHISMDLHSLVYRKDFNEDMSTAATRSEIRGRFIADVAIDTPILSEETQMKYEQDQGAYKKTYTFNEYYYAEFLLQNEIAFKAKSKVVNAVLSSTNMTTNIAYICSQCGLTNVLMSPLSNRKNYTEFKIPPINAIDQIKNWIVNYKLHDAGTTLFLDLDRTYILSKEIKCTAWRTQEYKTVHVVTLNKYSEALAGDSGFYTNSKEKYHLIEIPPNSIQTSSVSGIPYKNTTDKITQSLSFYTNDVSMEALTPNKLFIVDIQSSSAKKHINGKYRIIRYSVEMEPGGDYFNAKFNITLGK